MTTLIIGTGVLSNNLSTYFKLRGLNTEQISSREFKKEKIKNRQYDAIIFSGFLARKIDNSIDSFHKNLNLAGKVIDLLNIVESNYLIFLSTIDVYGSKSISGRQLSSTITKFSSIRPQDHYSLAKFCIEKLLELSLEKKHTKLKIIRTPGIYGMQGEASIISEWIRQGHKENLLRVNTTDGLVRTFLYWEDLANLFYKIITDQTAKTDFLITLGSHERMKLFEIAQIIADTIGCQISSYTEKEFRRKKVEIYDGAVFEGLGLKYTPLRDGIRQTWINYRAKNDY